jgi:predicted metal-dependent enzyme (double-stranded beta helix superfamily)
MRAAQLTLRRDLVFSRQETAGRVVFVVQEPTSRRLYRIGEVEHFVARQFDGATPLDTVRRRAEERFGASLTPETLQQFIEKLRGRGLLVGDPSGTFELDRFLSRCKDAVGQPRPAVAVHALMREAMSDVAAVGEALQSILGDSLSNAPLFRSSELLILNTVLVPGLVTPPHDHATWAVIGVYGGREDNRFYRRSTDGLEEIARKELRVGSSILLDPDVIHSVANPLEVPTVAIHVYGADLLAARRSMWHPHTLEACDYDPARFLKWCAQLRRTPGDEAPARGHG